jgi:mono/diheme cytochrome c family protein
MRGITTTSSRKHSVLALALLLGACSTNGRLLDTEKQAPGPTGGQTGTTPPPVQNNNAPPKSADAGAPAADGPTMSTTVPIPSMLDPNMPAPAMPTTPATPTTPTMPAPAVAVSNEGVPADVALILQARCASCHTYGQGDLAGWGSVLDLSRMIDAEIVVPGNPAASRMIDRVQVRGDMPPKGDRVPAAEVAKLRGWITALQRPASTPRTDEDILDVIATDVNKQRSFNSDFRYFSLAHFVDQGRPAKELTVAKNALGFLVNSLSRRGTIVPMVPIDSQGSIYRVRLSDLGWSAALWDTLTGFYPFCLASDVAGHQALYTQLGTEAPFVRADWLLDTASRAPLYDLLVDLPNNLNDLGRKLGVDIADDINHLGKAEPDNLVRFAVQRSGVALHNRMAERHLGAAGQFLWISYDFRSDVGDQDIFANPLGPKAVDENKFVHTFQNDAGEVIFTMPNGMQGYMLVNAQGQKIALADTAIVKDIRRPNAVVENGISCFGCHGGTGMIRPRDTDEMRAYLQTHVADFTRNEFNEVSVLYPPLFQPDLFTLDANRYRGIVESLDGGGPARTAEYTEFVALVGGYESNLGFRGVAAEFNEDPATFTDLVLANDFQNRAFPRTPAEPLISRTDFICAFRDLAPKIRPQRFCDKTFDAAAVRGLCR